MHIRGDTGSTDCSAGSLYVGHPCMLEPYLLPGPRRDAHGTSREILKVAMNFILAGASHLHIRVHCGCTGSTAEDIVAYDQ